MKTGTKIVIVIVILLIIGTITYFILKPKTATPILPLNTNPGGSNAKPVIVAPVVPVNHTSSAPLANDNFPLVIGSQGPNVATLQTALNAIANGPVLTVDGVLDADTASVMSQLLASVNAQLPMGQTQFNNVIAQSQGNNVVFG